MAEAGTRGGDTTVNAKGYISEMVLACVPRPWRDRLRAQLRFRDEFKQFRAAAEKSGRWPVRWDERRPYLNDRLLTGFDRQYFYHLAWAARVLAATKPMTHVDISSHLDFSAILSAFVPVRFYDYHALPARLDALTCGQADLKRLPFDSDTLTSISCLHVIEHVGLGRYGDPLDPDGDLKAFAELRRVLTLGGQLLVAVPVGRPRVEFNAHRVYSTAQVLDALRGLTLKEFALIPDRPEDGALIRQAPLDLADRQEFGCGCFWLVK